MTRTTTQRCYINIWRNFHGIVKTARTDGPRSPLTGLGGTVKLLAPSAVLIYRKILLLLRIVNSHHAKRTYKSAVDA